MKPIKEILVVAALCVAFFAAGSVTASTDDYDSIVAYLVGHFLAPKE